MSGLELLRRILATQAAGQAQGEAGRLPSLELRFALEYGQAPDIAAERQALAALLGAEGFLLQPLFAGGEPELARILVLRFPGIERTLSREILFSIAYELADARDLVRVEPDLGAQIYADPLEPGTGVRPEVADVLGPLCWVDSDTPDDRRWALAKTGVLRAWARFPSRGEGILIGQPDTGVAEHQEVDRGALDLAHARNILDGSNDPTDPLTPGTGNPGHGTGTASVVISRDNGVMIGSAPGAMLVPIRCIEDVKIIDGAPLAAAIEHATRSGCDIITMSLGGLPSLAVRAAVRDAVRKNVIVLAAAGNCVRLVVYPARYDDVIAVAGVNIADQPWLGSCRGRDVDISAPGELVWRADRRRVEDSKTKITGGQGTSFAVALTAGIAALWLSHHGRDAVRAECRRRGVTVQALFKSAMQATCRKPAIWDPDDFGPGIVDAEPLLGLALDAIPAAAAVEAARAAASVERLLEDAAGQRRPDPAFDWKRYGLEVASILYEDARLGRVNPLSTEASLPNARPSSQLAAATQHSPDVRLRALGARQPRGVRMTQPADFPSPPPNLIQILGRPSGQGLESAGSITVEAARAHLREGGIKRTLDRAEERMQAIEKREGDNNPAAAQLRAELLGQSEEILHRVANEGLSRIASNDRAILEALVSLTDRPAIRVENDHIDRDHPELGPWKEAYVKSEPEINAAFLSVGRIDVEGQHVGTGFVVDDGVVMTNRHVIEEFAAPIPKRTDQTRWVLQSTDVTINFSDNARGVANAFRIKSIIDSGRQPIVDEPVEFAKLDMALLEVETTNTAGKHLPRRLALLRDPAEVKRNLRIFAVGYPARVQVLPTVRTDEVMTRVRAIYGTKYGVKYFSPGIITAMPGQTAGDGRNWVFNHDATTLGGNSGSATFDLDQTIAILGLHFAGDWLRANHAHAVAAVRTSNELPQLDGFDWI